MQVTLVDQQFGCDDNLNVENVRSLRFTLIGDMFVTL